MGETHIGRVFISYSHRDQSRLDELLTFLGPLERDGVVTCWSDKQIRPGVQWRDEIFAALSSASYAVLLISQSFLDSEFIISEELPRISNFQKEGKLTILTVILSPLDREAVAELLDTQMLNPLDRPLSGMSKHNRLKQWSALAGRIREIVRSEFHACSLAITPTTPVQPITRPNFGFSSFEFLKQAIKGLLVRTPNASDIRVLGEDNNAIDIAFTSVMPLLSDVRYACILSLGAKRKRDESNEAIAKRIATAISSPIIRNDGSTTVADKILYVSPVTMSGPDQATICELVPEGNGRLEFVTGRGLIEQFSRYWPDFFADEALAIDEYLRQMKQELDDQPSLRAVATSYNLGSIDATLRKVYVSQNFSCELFRFKVATDFGLKRYLPKPPAITDTWTAETFESALSSVDMLELEFTKYHK